MTLLMVKQIATTLTVGVNDNNPLTSNDEQSLSVLLLT